MPLAPVDESDLMYKQFAMRMLTFAHRYAPGKFPLALRNTMIATEAGKVKAPIYVDSSYLNMYFGNNQSMGHTFTVGSDDLKTLSNQAVGAPFGLVAGDKY